MGRSTSLAEVVLGKQAAREAAHAEDARSAGRIVEGRVLDVGPAGVRFTLDFDRHRHRFGPAPWNMSAVEPAVSGGDPPHDHAATAPPTGARCLVVFVGEGIENPWVVAWWA